MLSKVLNPYNISEGLLSKDDALVLIFGANDVALNEAELGINAIKATLDETNYTQVILVGLPNRFNLKDWTCVNKEVRNTNAKLKELSLQYSNISLIELSKAEKNLHTRHSMHLNIKGKMWLAEQILIAATKNKVLSKQITAI